MTVYIGDTPEQLKVKGGNWVDVIVVEGKCYDSAAVAELVAQVEALAKDRDEWREAASKVISVIQLSGIAVNNGYFTKCLRQIQADAVLGAVKSCVVVECFGTKCISVRGLDEYAARVKAGEL